MSIHGALLIDKPEGITSFHVIELLQRNLMQKKNLKKKDLPKLGHGGTLDPFATGLVVVLVGDGAKLARYFLGSKKAYDGKIQFGITTVPGDPTAPISERSSYLPKSLEEVQSIAHLFTLEPYLQTPPMTSAKKKDGKPLYELARAGLEIERKAVLCSIYEYEITSYQNGIGTFRVKCSAGTYIRTLTQDLGRKAGSVALLNTLCRTGSGNFRLGNALTLSQIQESKAPWNELSCWIPFDRLLDGYPQVEVTPAERQALIHGKQEILPQIGRRVNHREQGDWIALSCEGTLVAVIRKEERENSVEAATEDKWTLERVFVRDSQTLVPPTFNKTLF